jgi:lipoprotein-anchoring transpeptidase ErfK/SrfK
VSPRSCRSHVGFDRRPSFNLQLRRLLGKTTGAVQYLRPLATLVPLVVLAACSKKDAPVTESSETGETAVILAAEAGNPAAPASGAPVDGPWAYVLGSTTPVFSASEFPAKDPSKTTPERRDVVRLGYLRKGTRIRVKPTVIKKANCAEGWFELQTGGFVCGKYATSDAEHKDLKNAPHPPYTDRPLPYDYGLNITAGTPLYRRLPLKKERAEHEKALAIGKGVKQSDVAKKLAQSGEPVPAYLKNKEVGFAELKGETGLVAEHMLRGFYLALDSKVSGYSGTFWRTTLGLFAPKDHIIVHKPTTEFEGVELAAPGEKRKLPLAFVVGTRARQFTVTEDRAKRHDELPRFTIVSLTDKKQVVEDRRYYETTEGYWVRDIDINIVRAPTPPPNLAPGEKWIDVDLTSQGLVAMEGDKPVYATIVSTGVSDPDPAKDHSTVVGTFRVREKHVTDTMDDDSNGTYRIEDVPWVMYFEKSYAVHGAFWHSRFGRERSHGCVNLTPHDAKRIFQWAGPTLPEGWHGISAKPDNPGSLVVVHK